MAKKKLFAAVCAAIMMLSADLANAEMGPSVGAKKKLIAWGVNAVDSTYLKEHVADLEKEYAIDGIVITFVPDHWRAKGNRGFQTSALFGGRKHKRSDFKKSIAELKATKCRRFTDNFLYASATVRGTKIPSEANVDWFDSRWSNVISNMALYAGIAKEIKFKGLMFDVEFYRGGLGPWDRPFSYVDRPDKDKRSLDECKAQARKCGRQMMKAMTKAYPEITLIIIPSTGWGWVSSGYELFLPFVEGVLEGLGPEATLVDGGEGGYPLQNYKDFLGLRQAAEKRGPEKCRFPELYRKRMRYGFGLWIDYNPKLYGGWHTAPGELAKNYRSPLALEHGLYNALTASDSYVWLYVWHPQYFWNPESRLKKNLHRQAQNQCPLCPHSVMPQGYLDAFKNCRKPHDLAWVSSMYYEFQIPADESIKPAKLAAMGENILKNGDFEQWRRGKDKAPDYWPRGGTGEEVEVKSGSCSLKLIAEKPGHIFTDQEVPISSYAGKTILFGAWVKTTSQAGAFLSIMDWAGSDFKYTNSREHPRDGTWQFLVAERTIRKDAIGEIWFRLSASPHKPGVPVFFDDAVAVVVE